MAKIVKEFPDRILTRKPSKYIKFLDENIWKIEKDDFGKDARSVRAGIQAICLIHKYKLKCRTTKGSYPIYIQATKID